MQLPETDASRSAKSGRSAAGATRREPRWAARANGAGGVCGSPPLSAGSAVTVYGP